MIFIRMSVRYSNAFEDISMSYSLILKEGGLLCEQLRVFRNEVHSLFDLPLSFSRTQFAYVRRSLQSDAFNPG